MATTVAKIETPWAKGPANHPRLSPDLEGPFAGWKKRLSVYTNRVEYEVAIVEIWIDPRTRRSRGTIYAQ